MHYTPWSSTSGGVISKAWQGCGVTQVAGGLGRYWELNMFSQERLFIDTSWHPFLQVIDLQVPMENPEASLNYKYIYYMTRYCCINYSTKESWGAIKKQQIQDEPIRLGGRKTQRWREILWKIYATYGIIALQWNTRQVSSTSHFLQHLHPVWHKIDTKVRLL